MTSGLTQQILDDPVLGRRTVALGDDGLPARVEFADGADILVDRSPGELILRNADGIRLARLQVAQDGSGEQVLAQDATSTTAASVSDSCVRVERDGAVLRIDLDDNGRPRRVRIPGLPDELEYRPIGAGGWEIGQAGHGAQIQIFSGPDSTSYDFGSGHGWTESARPGRITATTAGGSRLVTVDLDHAGRIIRRRWNGGTSYEYVRDAAHRLAGWRTEHDGVLARAERRYRGSDLSELIVDSRRVVVKTDDGHRITKLVSLGNTVRFGYDDAGRRVRREGRPGHTDYRYDVFGQLCTVTTADGETSYGWDALGRRVSVQHNGIRRYEHRDMQGRLWSVTDEDGNLVHAFIWWDGRVLARYGADGAIDETYLTDPVGTLMGIAVRPTETSSWLIEEAFQPPFGAPSAPWRPTLFGHIADGYTPLICFGARDLDTETGMFLTPDPWHGDADDLRIIAGASAASLVQAAEAPLSGIHPYLLSQGDPVSRPDVDGHWSGWTHVVVMMLLSSTWGFPLTSVSSFFFMPINIYMEVFGALVFGLKKLFGNGEHPWPQHSIFNSRLMSGSSHLHTLALALNGILPRASTGLSGDRCVTVGHVVWENRQYFNMLDRPRVLELDDIRGTPKADGTPSADGRSFTDTAAGSVLAITSVDKRNSSWIHGTWWTRGPGNAVGLRGTTVQSFEDRRVGTGTGPVRGTVMLGQPLPEIMDGRLSVEEYKVAATSQGVVAHDNWFAYQVGDKAGLKPDTVVELHRSGTVVPACGNLIRIVAGKRPIAILDHEPARFVSSPRQTQKLRLRRLKVSTTTSANWQPVAGGVANKTLELAAPGHPVAVDEVFEMSPATSPAATPERKKAYSRIAKVAVTLELTPTIAGLTVAGASLTRMTSDGTASNGNVPDPTGHPDQFTITGGHKFVVGDLVAVLPTGATESHHGRITAVIPAVPAVPPAGGTPGKPAEPAKLTLDPPFALTAATAVRITRLKVTNAKLDIGTNASNPSGDLLRCEVKSSTIFAKDQVVQIDIGGTAHVRRVKAFTNVDIETHDEYIGTGPFILTKYDVDGSMIDTANAAKRFVKHTAGSGPAPSTFGTWPAELMGLVPTAYPAERSPRGWRFFLRSTPTGIHRDFKDFWEPFKLGADEYWLLASELPVVQDGGTLRWEPDPDDTHPRRHRQVITAPITLTIKQFATSGVKRPDGGGGPVRALKAEAQVPEAPLMRWSLADALAEHELSHTVQNAYFGPFLGALPLQHLLPSLTKDDVFGADPPSWLDFIEPDQNMLELLSIGGIMQLVWSNLVVGPLKGEIAALDYMKTKDFDDSAEILNPINRLLIDAVPAPDPGVDEDWKVTLTRFVLGALDLRSWTPFTGFVPLLLPDGPKNFIEQQASRWSGDLYSTILTADDKFNVKTSFIGNDMSNANLTSHVGDSVRMMSYYSDALTSNVLLDQCDAPGSALTQLYEAVDGSEGSRHSFLQMEATADGWVPAALYRHVGGPVPTTVSVDVPAASGTGTVATDFLKVPTGCVLEPLLRSIVPIPPAVIRAVGFYLINAAPGKWKVTAHDGWAGSSDDPRTATAAITFDSLVRLGSEDVPWSEPFASGAPIASPPATLLDRFITESEALTVTGRNTTSWKTEADPGITLTPRAGGRGWDLAVAAPPGGVAPPPKARVRLWAKVAKDDPALFDLLHNDIPTLKGRRSYLDDDLWLPVRDFVVQINDLVVPTPGAFDAADAVEVDLPVKLAGRANIVPSSALIDFVRVKNVPPRGEQWRFRLKDRKAIEKTTKVPVVIKFGAGPTTVDRTIDLTINPNFTIDVSTAGAKYEATSATALDLTITGGSVDFTAVGRPPAATRARVDVTGRTVTVTVDPPTAARPAVGPTNYELVVRDGGGKLGVRTITLKD